MNSLVVIDCGSWSTKYAKRDSKTKHLQTVVEVPTMGRDTYSVISEVLQTESETDDINTALCLVDALTPRREKEDLLYYLFEKAEMKRVALVYSSTASLFTTGESSGLCLDVGYSGVRGTTILDSVCIADLSFTLETLGSHAVDTQLKKVYDVSDGDLVSIKKQMAFTEKGGAALESETFDLPDGKRLQSDASVLAQQSLLRGETENALFSFLKLYERCVTQEGVIPPYLVTGGGSLMRGLNAVVSTHLQRYLPFSSRELLVKNQSTCAVEGGVIVSQLSSFKLLCVDAEEYAEEGPSRCCMSKMVDCR